MDNTASPPDPSKLSSSLEGEQTHFPDLTDCMKLGWSLLLRSTCERMERRETSRGSCSQICGQMGGVTMGPWRALEKHAPLLQPELTHRSPCSPSEWSPHIRSAEDHLLQNLGLRPVPFSVCFLDLPSQFFLHLCKPPFPYQALHLCSACRGLCLPG